MPAEAKNLPEGWLTGPEARTLRRLATGKVVLELGAFKGRSTVVMAETAALVISVDRHNGIYGDEDTFPEFLANIRELGNVIPIIAEFDFIVPHITDIDMVYIDGNHDYDTVTRDIRLLDDLQPEIVAFHDWDFKEVKQAGMDAYGAADGLVGSVAWYTT